MTVEEADNEMNSINLNGVDMSLDVFEATMNDVQDAMIEEQYDIASQFGVSEETASAIQYLRTRSRHTPEKEAMLIAADKAGTPIPVHSVLSGEF